MTKPDRVRDDGTETEREAKKKRNSSGEELEVHPPFCDRAALQHARPPQMRQGGGVDDPPSRVDEMAKVGGRPVMRDVGDDQDESVTETNDGARVHEMTKAGGHPEMREAGDDQDESVTETNGGTRVDEMTKAGGHPEMREAGDDQDESVTETNGARVDEITKEEEEKELSSFTPKSPINMPYIPDERNDPTAYPETFAAFKKAQVKYKAKLRRRYRLFTSAHKGKVAPSCLFNRSHLLPIRDSARKAVLHAAKSIIRLSSFVDGKPLSNTCGLWIEWDKEKKMGIVLTTAHLIRSNHARENDHWEGRDEYNIEAKVILHLLDGTTVEGHYLYHQEHYDLALFKVRVDKQVQLASFNGSVHCGQDVFWLGRDDHMTLRITHGRVENWNPGSNERHHYMYFFHQENDYPSHQRNDTYPIYEKKDDYLYDDDGGSVIGLDGKVVGLVNKHLKKSFIPSCILVKCLDLWSKFGCIPRLHLGMKFTSIRLLDPIHADQLWRMYEIGDGLIVQEVSKESRAEKHGICLGDIIECFNGECISTTVELESLLLGRCMDLDVGNHLNTEVAVSIQVLHTEERHRRIINLAVNVSDGVEVVTRRTCPITATEGTSASVHSSQNVADDRCLPRPLTWEEMGERFMNASAGKVQSLLN